MENLIKSVIDNCTPVALKIIASIVILFLGTTIIKFVIKRLKKGKLISKMDDSLSSFFISFIKISLYVVLFLTLASVIGIPMASFVTVLASAGVAIGLALQGALSNFAGGIMILLFKPFKVGNYIKTGDLEGTVSSITVFYTFIVTLDNKTITLPNGTLTNTSVINYSTQAQRRVDLFFTASYSSDIELVKKVLLDCALNNENVLKDPAPFAGVTSQKDSSIEYTLRVWCDTEKYWSVFFALQESVKPAFDKNGIEIPFIQIDIHNK